LKATAVAEADDHESTEVIARLSAGCGRKLRGKLGERRLKPTRLVSWAELLARSAQILSVRHRLDEHDRGSGWRVTAQSSSRSERPSDAMSYTRDNRNPKRDPTIHRASKW